MLQGFVGFWFGFFCFGLGGVFLFCFGFFFGLGEAVGWKTLTSLI